jgi:hypothetical protein
LASANKCLAQSNKSRHVSRATKDEAAAQKKHHGGDLG